MIDYKNSYIGKNFNSLSQLGNTLTHGDSDVSISGRIGFNYLKHRNLFWVICKSIVDFTFYPIEGWGHCERAYKADLKEIYSPKGNVWGLAFMCLLLIVFCLILSIIFYSYKLIHLINERLFTQSRKRNKH